MHNLILKDFLGGILVLTSIADAWKYIWNAQSIKKIGTARGHSRKFINAAILNDIVKLSYGTVINDLFIILSSLLALVTMGYLFWTIYKFYPFKYRGLHNFKKPHILLYLINSMLPNRIRKRL
jgi:hypothetical protein